MTACCGLCRVICDVLSWFSSEKGTTSVQWWIVSWIQAALVAFTVDLA